MTSMNTWSKHMLSLRVLAIVLSISLFCLPSYGANFQVKTNSASDLTVKELQAQYPNALLIEVDETQYQKILSRITGRITVISPLPTDLTSTNIVIVLALNQANSLTNALPNAAFPNLFTVGSAASNTKAKNKSGVSAPNVTQTTISSSRHRARHHHGVHVSTSGDRARHHHGFPSLGDEAVVIFVIVGLVVVAALVVYAPAYIYDVLVNHEEVEYWWDVGTHYTRLLSNNRSGYMTAMKFASGFTSKGVQVGLAGEIGYIRVDADPGSEKMARTLDGSYWLIGPAIRWLMNEERNPDFPYVELLAGTAEEGDIGVLSVARAGYNWGVNDHLRMGLSIGSVYLNLDADGSLIQDDERFSVVYGAELAFRF